MWLRCKWLINALFFCYSNKLFSIIPPYEFNMVIAKRVAPLTFVYVGMLVLNNLCLKYVEVTFYQVSVLGWTACKGNAGVLTVCFPGCQIIVHQLYHLIHLRDPWKEDIHTCFGRLFHCVFGLCYRFIW